MLSCAASSVHRPKPRVRHRSAASSSSRMLRSRSRSRGPAHGQGAVGMGCVCRRQPAPLCLDFKRCPGSRREVTAAGVQSAAPRDGPRSPPGAESLHNPAATAAAAPQKGPLPARHGPPHSLPSLLGDGECLFVQNSCCSGSLRSTPCLFPRPPGHTRGRDEAFAQPSCWVCRSWQIPWAHGASEELIQQLRVVWDYKRCIQGNSLASPPVPGSTL